ncbi:MAG TPA: cupin domain-containing protein [Firmicutes bacterium]|nr:cupin domain-containing protein [Bacillota bacterium]
MKIGEKIKRLRMQHDLTQEELADRCELSKGFISQLERELTSPSIATLVDILESLGTNLADFFSDAGPERVVFTEEDVSIKSDDELGCEIHWLIPTAQKNGMEPILVYLQPGGRTAFDDPHDGEEFGYVLEGEIYLNFGSRKKRIGEGEAFYFKAQAGHYIANAGKKRAGILWVAAPPSF